MRTYKLVVAYDGSRFRGWQKQPDTEQTIQGILERTLSEITGYIVDVQGSGRTDRGVHAKAQVASVVLSGKIDEKEYQILMNQRLPEDICICSIELMKNGFHARKKAHGKHYVYTIDKGERPGVFTRKYAYHFPKQLDIIRMRQAVQHLCGRHNFAAFTDRIEVDKSTVREIYDIKIEEKGNLIEIDYYGSGFMYHMVRILTGTLLEIGTGERNIEQIQKALHTGVRQEAGGLAPANGLCLTEVTYN